MNQPHTTAIIADAEPDPDELRELIARKSAVVIEDPERIVISGIRELHDS